MLTLLHAFPAPRTVTSRDDLNYKYSFTASHSDSCNETWMFVSVKKARRWQKISSRCAPYRFPS